MKLLWSIIGFGGCGKKIEEGKVRYADENTLSHHFLEEVAVNPKSAGESGG